MASVTFDNATRLYPGGTRAAVDKLSLDVADGEFLVLVGPSGCGKSTSLRMLAGLEEVNSGRIMIGDRDVTDVPPKDRDIAMVFQNYALYPHMTVAENMGFALKIAGVGKDERATRVLEAAKLLDLEPYLSRKPKALSGGQRQRVAMGRAIVRNPQVFLMDEPLSNLDAKLREEARAFLRELIVRLGLSALMVTHDQAEAMAISDRILLLNNGKIEQQGTPQSMYEAPDTLFTAEFMGSNNRLPAEVVQRDGAAARLKVGGMALNATARGAGATGDTAALIRVEEVRIGRAPVENGIQLPLSTCMYLGDRWECLFKSGEANVRAYSRHRIDPGNYWLEMPAEKLWVF